MKTNIKPLGDNILVEKEEEIKGGKTEAGIYLPEEKEEKSQVGKVLAIGDSEEIKVKKGQTVVFKKFGGNEVELEGKEYLLLKNEDVLAVIE